MILGHGYYWMEIDEDGNETGHVCSAWYGMNDKPMATSIPKGTWILVKHMEELQNKLESENAQRYGRRE